MDQRQNEFTVANAGSWSMDPLLSSTGSSDTNVSILILHLQEVELLPLGVQ